MASYDSKSVLTSIMMIGGSPKVFHYRYPLLLAVIGAMHVLFIISIAGLSWFMYVGDREGADWVYVAGMLTAFFLTQAFFIPLQLYVWNCKIWVDDKGIHSVNWLKRQTTFSWEDVDEIDCELDRDVQRVYVSSNGSKMGWTSTIIGYDELLEEVSRRAPVAIKGR